MLKRSTGKAIVTVYRGLLAGAFAAINLAGIAFLGIIGYYIYR